MGFSLMGFGAGLAESAIERIEEERKFSNLALQGRIERASVLKMQREKEAEAIRQELTAQRASLEQFGITDPELQKAYLSAPTAAEALKKTLETGNVGKDAVNQYAREFITINQSRLFQGTPDDMIKAAAAARAGTTVEPARVMPTEGGSIFAPSVSGQQRRLQQLASARGMTLEEVARAESPMAPARPEVAASINLEMLKKPQSAQQQLDAFKGKIISLSTDPAFGPDHPDTKKAVASFKTAQAALDTLEPQQLEHNRMLSRSLRIVLDPTLNVSPEERKVAEMYVRNHKRLQDSGEKTDKIPSPTSLASLMARAANHAIEAEYGSKVTKDFAMRSIDPEDKDSPKVLDYIGDDMNVRREILRLRQEAAYSLVKPELATGGKIHPNIRFALGAFGIKEFDEKNNPKLLPVSKGGGAPKTPREQTDEAVGAATAAPAATPASAPRAGAGRAPQGGAPTAQKTMTRADVAATAKASKLSEEKVIEAAKAKGYTIIE